MVTYLFGENNLTKYLKILIPDSILITKQRCDFKENNEVFFNYLIRENDVVINCFEIKNQEDNQSTFMKINTMTPLLLGKICQNKRARLIYISTNKVFSGFRGEYDELDFPDSKSDYGQSKYLGECTEYNSMIIRADIIDYDKYLTFEIDNQDIKGFINHYQNGITCYELAKFIKQTIEDKAFWKGIRHIYGETTTNYDLVKIILEIYKLENLNLVLYSDFFKIDETLNTVFFKPKFCNLRKMIREQKIFHEKNFPRII